MSCLYEGNEENTKKDKITPTITQTQMTIEVSS
jgi:hypothetical protein